MQKKGVLLINVGTPDDCRLLSVFRYLKQFLSDPRVIDLPKWLRWPLVNLFILPLRTRWSANAYSQIWTEQGSPLLINSQQLQKALAQQLGDNYQVALGMRYGNPTIAHAVQTLADCSHISIVPLYPQYSSAATGSALSAALQILSKQWNIANLQIGREFYNNPGFVQAYSKRIAAKMNVATDFIVFSYHSLPERHLDKSGCKATCDRLTACPSIATNNTHCYRAQCYATSQLIAKQLGLRDDQYQVAFQSRLGRIPWVKPYIDKLLPTLIARGIKNIAVVCPSFVADCLETLEEVNIRMRENWRKLGGGEFNFIPCVNDDAEWVTALAKLSVKVSVDTPML